ncbi:MAG: hypothetical protein JEZ09_17870 [Salinivirgaceae bacterium]|nr:hypothetical protein [Salinivirgaceae bacterium]
MKKLIYLIFSILLYGCLPCDTIMIENGALPDSTLKYVPYVNGKTYKFKHSNGLKVNYKTTRETHEEWTSCAECCKYEYHYEVNSTILIPDYPIFEFQFQIDNRDTLNYNCYASIGKYGFYIPTNNEYDIDYYEQVDSVQIDSVYYYQVFKLKSNYDNYYSRDSIYVDSIYYSYDKGIIKILLSNNENYTIYE